MGIRGTNGIRIVRRDVEASEPLTSKAPSGEYADKIKPRRKRNFIRPPANQEWLDNLWYRGDSNTFKPGTTNSFNEVIPAHAEDLRGCDKLPMTNNLELEINKVLRNGELALDRKRGAIENLLREHTEEKTLNTAKQSTKRSSRSCLSPTIRRRCSDRNSSSSRWR